MKPREIVLLHVDEHLGEPTRVLASVEASDQFGSLAGRSLEHCQELSRSRLPEVPDDSSATSTSFMPEA